MEPQQSLAALPYAASASLFNYESEGESEDEWMESKPKRKKNAHRVGPPVIPPVYLNGQLPNIAEQLYGMGVGLALDGIIQNTGHFTLYRHEKQPIGNKIVVKPQSIPINDLVWVGLFLYDPKITKIVRFPPTETNNNTRAHGGIIGNTADLFGNGGLALVKTSVRGGRAKIQWGFELGRYFKSEISAKHAQFVLCLVPMEDGQYMVNEAVRSEPFFVKSKRTNLGKRGPPSQKQLEVKKLKADVQTKIGAIKKVKEQLRTLHLKRRRLNDCTRLIQREVSENRGKGSIMLCLALDLLTRPKNKVNFDNEEEEECV